MRHHLGHKSLVAIMAAAMVVLLGIGVFVYRARARTLAELRAELTQKQTELAGAKARIAKRPQLEKEYAALRAELAVLEPTLPTYAYVPTFLKQIEALATDTDNAVAGVRPQPKPQTPPAAPAAAEGEGGGEAKPASEAPGAKAGAEPAEPRVMAYDHLPIEISLVGGYWSTAEFLSHLATFPKMIAVNDLQVAPAARAEGICGAPDLQVRLNLLALIYKDGEEEPWTSDAKNSPS